MAYDEVLAGRIRELLSGEPGIAEKGMFGGLAFLLHGNMSVSVSGQGGMMLRVEPGRTGDLLRLPHARPFEMRGKEMAGWLRVDAEGLRAPGELEAWVARGVDYARTLPPKR